MQPMKLAGFNDLTKSLRFNLYDFVAACDDDERRSYQAYVAQHYDAGALIAVLRDIAHTIDARVIAASPQDYTPWGASAMVLLSDDKVDSARLPGNAALHLDKSHVCAHTYPDAHPSLPICSVRIDIDIATCGEITPLRALDRMFRAFDSDVVVIDYVVRGSTRDSLGRRVYLDHPMRSVRDFIDPGIQASYEAVDLALPEHNIWQTKLLRTRFDEDSYFRDPLRVQGERRREILDLIRREMAAVAHRHPS